MKMGVARVTCGCDVLCSKCVVACGVESPAVLSSQPVSQPSVTPTHALHHNAGRVHWCRVLLQWLTPGLGVDINYIPWSTWLSAAL